MKQLKRDKKRKGRYLIIILVVCIILTYFVPVRFSKKTFEEIETQDYYIFFQIPSGSTDSGNWICIGNQNGKYDEPLGVQVFGKLPQEMISKNVIDTYTKYVLYGTLNKSSDNKYIFKSVGWDFFEDIKRNNNFLGINFNHFITIYDLKWVDKFPFILE